MNKIAMTFAGVSSLLFAAAPAVAQHVTPRTPNAETAAVPQAPAPQSFLRQAIEGNLAEVQMGKLVQQKAGDDAQLRQFGEMLSTDHAANNQKAEALARSLKMTPPTAPNAEQKRMYQDLSQLSGSQFRRQLADDMITDHKKDIAKYSAEAKSSNPEVAQYAQATLPTLRKHLQAAESLAQASSNPK